MVERVFDAGTALGGRLVPEGARFGLYAPHAHRVELCLLDHRGSEERVDLRLAAHGVWAGRFRGIAAGQRYAFRVEGRSLSTLGRTFHPEEGLLDPRALALTPGDEPLALLADPTFDWGDDRPPATPWPDTVIYEAHVRGMTMRHPEVPPRERGTYLGLAHPAVIEHLRSLGVTAVELMPIQHFLSEPALLRRGLTNYWGYNPVGFFAPHAAYATAPGLQIRELQEMVAAFHRAGIEVLLDVVFNHTAEGAADGPVLAWKGFGDESFYRLDPHDPSRFENWTGCGNTLHAGHTATLELVVDALRHWVETFRVDGFRFDLAPILGRPVREFDARAPFFRRLREDPLLAGVKLIAEPWDLGPGGYRLGSFPVPWREWNDRFRDTVRSFWRGDPGRLPELAARISGSSDPFGARGPSASLQYVAIHDGPTLADLVAYERKHNHANGENNRDGTTPSFGRNWGVEGPTTDPAIRELRHRVRRSLLATLAFSRGVPMLSHGDELGRSQRGNNNAYCQDNELTWLDWEPSAEKEDLLAFVRRIFALRRRYPSLRADRHLGGTDDATWLAATGAPLSIEEWNDPGLRTLGLHLHDADPELLLLFHAGEKERLFLLPAGRSWHRRLDTGRPQVAERRLGRSARLRPYSLSLFEAERASAALSTSATAG